MKFNSLVDKLPKENMKVNVICSDGTEEIAVLKPDTTFDITFWLNTETNEYIKDKKVVGWYYM